MLLFRSEEHVRAWQAAHPGCTGAVSTPEQMWTLARAWDGRRLAPDWRRPPVAEAQDIFERIGLTGEFWRLSRG